MGKLKDPRHELFCQNRAVGQTCDAAYTNAGYKPNRGNAARLNANESIQARIGELMDDALSKTMKTLEEDYLALENLGHSNLADFFTLDADGLPEISLEGVTRDQTAALSDMTVDTINGKEGEKSCIIGRRVKIKLADKAGPLAKLIDLKEKQLARVEEERAKTIDGTTTRDDADDYLKDLGARFGTKRLEDARAMKARLLSPSGNGRAATTAAAKTEPNARSADDEDGRRDAKSKPH